MLLTRFRDFQSSDVKSVVQFMLNPLDPFGQDPAWDSISARSSASLGGSNRVTEGRTVQITFTHPHIKSFIQILYRVYILHSLILYVSLVPRPLHVRGRGKSGLVSNVCACVGFSVYFLVN